MKIVKLIGAVVIAMAVSFSSTGALYVGADIAGAEEMAPIGAGNAAQSADQAEKKDKSAQIAAIIMAAIMAMQCKPENPAACMMAAQAAMQAAQAAKAGKGAGASRAGLAMAAPPKVERGDGAGSLTTTEGVLADLKTKGVEISPDQKSALVGGLKLPMNADYTSASAQSLGLTPAQIAAGKAALAEAMEKTKEERAKLAGNDSGAASSGGAGGGQTVPGPATPEPEGT